MSKILSAFFLLFLISSCVLPSQLNQKTLYPSAFRNRHSWNILVYMNADNNLYTNSIADINEMENVEIDGAVTILVLWDGNSDGDTRLLEIKYDPSYAYGMGGIVSRFLSATIEGETITPTSGEVNMLDSQTLVDFIDFAGVYSPSDYTALIIWSHSDGWRGVAETRGVQADDNKGPEPGIDQLTNHDLSVALNGKGITVLDFDSCLQGSLETLWSLKSFSDVRYVLASTWEIYASGSDYHRFFKYFNDSYRRPMDFITSAIDAYKEQYGSFSDVSLLGYDLGALDTGILQTFISYANTNKGTEKPLFDGSQAFRQKSDSTILYRNLYDYAYRSNYASKGSVLAMLNKMIVYSWRDGSGYGFKGVALKHEIPDTNYNTIDLAVDTDWESFIAP